MPKIHWIIGAIIYTFLAALIPGAAWLFLGLLVDGATWFMGLSWGVKIPTYVVAGICLQLLRPIIFSEDKIKK